jgi:hypothetical protein
MQVVSAPVRGLDFPQASAKQRGKSVVHLLAPFRVSDLGFQHLDERLVLLETVVV